MLNWFAKRMLGRRADERGFTLIELLVVIIIVAILTAIAVPVYLFQRDKAREAVVEAEVRQAGQAVLACLAERPVTGCDTEAEAEEFGFNRTNETNPTFGLNAAGTGVRVTSAHANNPSIDATFDSEVGRLL